MSLEFENLHQKGRCEMLIGRGDIIKDPLVHVFRCLFTFVFVSTLR